MLKYVGNNKLRNTHNKNYIFMQAIFFTTIEVHALHKKSGRY